MWAALLLHVGFLQLQRAGATLELRCAGFSCAGAQALGMQASVALGLSCPAACEVFPDRGLNASPLHWQADS